MFTSRWFGIKKTFLTAVLLMLASFSYAKSMQNVLVLHSYDAAYGWTVDLQHGIEDAIDSASRPLKLSVEYLDTKRINNPRYYANMREYIRYKYSNYHFDGVIITDDNALTFFNSLDLANLKRLPTVAVGINNLDANLYSSTEKGTVIYEHDYIAENLRLIKQVRPNLEKLYFLSDYGVTSKITRLKVLEELTRHTDIKLVEIRNQSLAQAGKTLSKISPDDAVLLTHFNTEINMGTFYGYDEVARFISEKSAAPIFVFWEFYIKGDVLGGYVNRSYKMGVQAVEILGAKLDDPLEISIEVKDEHAVVFNHSALNRFDIGNEFIPKGTVILGKPSSYFQENMAILSVSGAIILLLFMVIVSLLSLLKQKKRQCRQQTDVLLKQTTGLEAHGELVAVLSDAIENRPGEGGRHVLRVAKMSSRLAMYAGLTLQEQEMIEKISTVHDIGKIGVPESILNKPGKLSADEWQMVQNHTKVGHKILSMIDDEQMKLAAAVALDHHEHWNGNGYPHGKSEYSIHIFARIITIVDVFDVLLTKRCYKEAWTIIEVIDYIKSRGGEQFDPHLAELFLEHINDFIQIRDLYTDGSELPAD
ncbi:HD domain-containing phosphohydrolase [Vibrio sp. SCSIO 43137]|uniref:HD domain-containing phosphohydrolase n=1 Tax=Vibrio sp. SCSIO 43137 TaxID=3021011 RepID=UPI00230826CE|nr:HD domain-containing phosphohydrolase [Vibrio sp. SCSIO 43137]WCE30875.1 HD domain-containing protein [Vibrio sp. SCSIO 43137]